MFADVNGDGVTDLSFTVYQGSLAASDFFGIAG